MKAVALISENNSNDSNQWQFDKVMSAIAYDMELTVVFMPNSIKQITNNKAWKSLVLYGIDNIYFYNSKKIIDYEPQFKLHEINLNMLKQHIQEADVIL